MLSIIGSASLFLFLNLIIGILLFNADFFVFGGLFGFLNLVFEWIADLFGVTIVFFLSCLLFPTVVTIMVGFFLEEIICSVEAQHYPGQGGQRKQGLSEIVFVTTKFAVLSLALNIIVLPLYLVFVFIGPLSALIFYVLNGYLVGREFFELVAYRRLELTKAKRLWRTCRGQVFLAGLIIAFMMTIPVINLLAPVVAAVAMVHLVEDWCGGINGDKDGC